MLKMDGRGYRHWARTPPETRIYAIGDLHGRLDLLDDMHDLIRDDARLARGRRTVVVYLGDYIDRGPHSRELIDRLLDRPVPEFETVYLRGNHEDIMLGFIDFGTRGAPWFRHGGRETLESYGIAAPQSGDEADFPAAQKALRRRLPASHRAFLDATVISHREGDYLFVHAGIKPGVAIADQDLNDFMWIRHEFMESEVDFGVCVVHGHTIEKRAVVKRNRIGLDTGAYASGQLSCAVLEDDRVRLLKT